MGITNTAYEAEHQAGTENYRSLIQLFERRRGMLLRVAMRITHNEDEAEDIVQESALKALLKLHDFRGESRIDTWICAIIAKSAINRLRSPVWRRFCSLDSFVPEQENLLSYFVSTSETSPEENCLCHELQEVVRSEIRGLKTSYRTAIQLCDLEGYSYLEAATALNMSLANFKARLRRGRRALRTKLRERILTRERTGPVHSCAHSSIPPAEAVPHPPPERLATREVTAYLLRSR